MVEEPQCPGTGPPPPPPPPPPAAEGSTAADASPAARKTPADPPPQPASARPSRASLIGFQVGHDGREGELRFADQTAALHQGEATVMFGDGQTATIPLADLRLIRTLE